MTTIITVANQKGGVGKTTTAVTLAHGLTLMGKGTLLIDLDPQGQCATSLGCEQEQGAFELLVTRTEPAQLVRVTGRKGLGLIPGDTETSNALILIKLREEPVTLLRDRLKSLVRGGGLQYIVFDTAPSVSKLQAAALWAADLLLIPTVCDFLALDGVAQIMRTMNALQRDQSFPWSGKLAGVLPTFYDDVTSESRRALDEIHEQFGDRVLRPVHRSTRLREAAAEGKTIFEYDNRSRAAQEYGDLVRLIARLG